MYLDWAWQLAEHLAGVGGGKLYEAMPGKFVAPAGVNGKPVRER